jgi:hypothetical protein
MRGVFSYGILTVNSIAQPEYSSPKNLTNKLIRLKLCIIHIERIGIS